MVLTLHHRRGWILTTTVALVALTPLALSLRTAASLRAQRAKTADARHVIAAARTENDRLRASLQALRSPDLTTVNRASDKLENLEEEIAAARSALPAEKVAEDPFGAGRVVDPGAWRNVGRGSPEAALQTVLWAAAGGDIDALASAMHLSSASHAVTAQALASLSPELRDKYGTPERLIAALTVADVPLAPARIRQSGTVDTDDNLRWIALDEFRSTDPRLVGLIFERDATGWALRVPDEIVQHYLATLKTGSG